MVDLPLVSVIVPTFDRAGYVGDAVHSALAQDVDLEVIVIDDGSTDETPDLLTELAAADERVLVLRQRNAGVSAARNAGVRASRGAWLSFVDSDDLMTPTRLVEQLERIGQLTPPALLIGAAEVVVAPGVTPPPLIRALLDQPPPWTYAMSMILSREVFDLVGGFDESLRRAEDTEFLVRCRDRGVHVEVSSRVWTVRRIFGDNLTYGNDPHPTTMLSLLRRRLAGKAAGGG